MKKLNVFSIFAFVFLLLSFTACSTDDDGNLVVQPPIDIPTTANNVEIPFATIEGLVLPGPFDILLDVDFDQEIQDAVPGLELDDVEEAVLKEFYVELDDSSFEGDLTAIKDMDVYVKGTDLEEIKVAEVRDNDNPDRIDFEVVTDEDLVDYLRAENVYVVLRDIVPGDNSLTTFTISVTPVWEAKFEL